MVNNAYYEGLEVNQASDAPEVSYKPDLWSPSQKTVISEDTWAASDAPQYAPPTSEQPKSAFDTSSPRSSCCGLSLKKRAVWGIVIAAVLAVALIGGLVGGLTSHKHTTTSDTQTGNTTNTTVPTAGPLASSQLAALNYTDSSNTSRRAVFYQNDGALYCNRYQSWNSSWSVFNISAAYDRDGSEDTIAVKPGTPIAVAAISKEDVDYLRTVYGNYNFAAALYIMDTDDRIRELVTHDYELESWTQGGLKDTVLHAADDSHLAAAGNFCPDTSACTNQMSIMYQDASANIKLANGSQWDSAIQVDVGYPGASLSIVPFNKDSGSNFTWVSDVQMFYYSNLAVRTYSYNWEGLVAGTEPIITNQQVVSEAGPQVVSSTANFHSQSIAVSMDGNGDFTASFYDYQDGWEHSQSAVFKNQGGNQTSSQPDVDVASIAMDQDGSLYGIVSNGSRISRYAWDPADPFTFTWKEDLS